MHPSTAPIVFIDVPALVRWRDATHLELLDLAAGTQLVADGEIARELWRCFESGERSERVHALSAAQPLLMRLLTAEQPRTWSPRVALEQGGFDTLFIELTGRCNERCRHCYAESSPEVTTALDRATCLTLLDDAVTLGFGRVQLTGGDPLLCPFLPELVAAADPRLNIEIYTNGLALKDELLGKLAPKRPSFAFSFYSSDAAHHDAITRTPGSQARTRAAISRAVAAGLSVRASIVVMRENANDVAATITMLEELGVATVSVSGAHAVGRGDYWDGKVERASLTHAPPAPDSDGPKRRGKLCVTATGDVTPCIFNRKDVLGRVPAARLVDIVAAPRLDALSRGDDALMLDAFKRSLQCGECRAAAFMLRAGGNA